MNIILDRKEYNNNTSFIAIHRNIVTNPGEVFLHTYLNSINDLKSGTSSFGDIPRLQKWYNESGEYFSKTWQDQSNPRWISCPYEPALKSIQNQIQVYFDNCNQLKSIENINIQTKFNSCLLNKYRDGMDSIKPHRDSEVIFGNNPTIAILSIGSTREMIFRRIVYDKNKIQSIKPDKSQPEEFTIKLDSGSLLVMGGSVQKYYSHEIIKKKNVTEPRYSLTFRQYM